MSFVIGVRWTKRNRAPTVPQTRLLASSVIIMFIASFFDPLSFIYTTPREVMSGSKTPTLGLAKAITTERRTQVWPEAFTQVCLVLLLLLQTVGICGPQRRLIQICSVYENN